MELLKVNHCNRSPSLRTKGLESFSSALCAQEMIKIEIKKEIYSFIKLFPE